MVNEESTLDSELQLEVTPDSESLETSQGSSNAEGEIEDSQLNLETDEPKADKANLVEENAKKQVEHWLVEVTAGRKSIEDAPGWVQKRMTAKLEAEPQKISVQDEVQKSLEAERETAEFKSIQDSIPQLTATQAKELQERFKQLRPAGKVIALRTALEAMGLSSKSKEAEQRRIAKGNMSLPRSGQSSVRKSEQTVDGVPLSTITSDAEWNRMHKAAAQS